MIFLLYTPVRRIRKRLSVGKATEAEKYGEVAEALGGSNKARQHGSSPLSLWYMFFSLYSHHGYVRIAYYPCKLRRKTHLSDINCLAHDAQKGFASVSFSFQSSISSWEEEQSLKEAGPDSLTTFVFRGRLSSPAAL